MEYTIASWTSWCVTGLCLLAFGTVEVGSYIYPGGRLLHESYCTSFPVGRLLLKCDIGQMIQIDDSIIFARDEKSSRLRALGNHQDCAYASRCDVSFQTYHNGFDWLNCLNVTFTCRPALCRPLRDPVFGSLSVTSYSVGSEATYGCDQGFILGGRQTIKCVHHDNHYFWYPDPPVCEYNCRNLIHSPHPVGAYESMCYEFIMAKKKWADAKSYCSKNNGKLITYESMDFFETGFDARPEIKLAGKTRWASFWTSSEEYRPRYCKILFVNIDKTSDHYTRWMECSRYYYSICEYVPVHPQRCGQLPVPKHGAKSFSNESIGAVVVFTCNDGYMLNGTRTRRCLSSGMWSGEQPKCVLVDCGTPESFENNPTLANVTFVKTTYLGFANYTCSAGHTLIGEALRMCTGNGTWSSTAPRCHTITTATSTTTIKTTTASTTATTSTTTTSTTAIKVIECGRPSTGNSSRGLSVVYNSTAFLGMASYTCVNAEHILVGDSTVFCTEDNKWNGTLPRCVPLREAVAVGQSNQKENESGVPGYVTAVVVIILMSTIAAVIVAIVVLYRRGKLTAFFQRTRTKPRPASEALSNPTYMEVNTNGDVINQDFSFSALNNEDETIYEEIPY